MQQNKSASSKLNSRNKGKKKSFKINLFDLSAQKWHETVFEKKLTMKVEKLMQKNCSPKSHFTISFLEKVLLNCIRDTFNIEYNTEKNMKNTVSEEERLITTHNCIVLCVNLRSSYLQRSN